MSIAQNFPSVLPTLNLSFALTKALDPRITFARASAATYYGTETAKAEENLLVRSQEFETGWGNSGTTDTPDTTVAPDGTTTADTLTADAGTGFRVLEQSNKSVFSGGVYTYSVFVQAGTNNFVQLYFFNTGFATNQAFANFDVTVGAGAVGTVGTSATATIADVGNGWYRCTIISTADATTSSSGVGIALILSSTSARRESWTTDGTETIILWGAQLEERSAVTSYTPTTNQPITNFVPVLESAAAGEARFDHNPVTGESLGLLIEESRTNLFTRSEEFDDAAWTKTNSSITANTIVAPSGELTGNKFVANNGISSSSSSFRSPDLSKAASPVTFAFSIYAKAGEHNTLRLIPRDPASGNNADVRFNLTNGTVISAVAGGAYTAVSGVITSVGNDWYRCTALFTTGSETALRPQVVQLNNNSGFTGDGFSGIFLWGASLEQGAFPTSYVKTTTAQVTRAADAASMTGANFSSFYNQAEGTLYAEFATATPTTARVYQIGDGTNNNRMDGFMAASTFRVFVRASGSVQTNAASTEALAANVFGKVSFAYKTNDFAVLSNAGTVATATSSVVPAVNQLGIGRRLDTTAFLSGHIRKIAYYPIRVTNAELQALTS